MRIVPATPADARAVADVHVRTWRAAYRGIVADAYLAALSVDQRETTWRAAIEAGTPELLVAKVGAIVAGWISFGPCRDDGAGARVGEIWALYVAPEFWSSGVGRSLWLAARENMVKEGYQRVSLWVITSNRRAIKFYSAAGFAAEPGSTKSFTLGGKSLKETRYAAALGD